MKQKLAISVIHNAAYNAHTESLFKKSSILPLPLLADFFKIQFMLSYNFNLLSSSFSNTWTTNFDRRRRENLDQPMLCNDSDFYVPFARTVATCNQPLIYYPKLWNAFTDPCKSTSKKSIFKKELKKYFLDKLDPNFVCARLLYPHCRL